MLSSRHRTVASLLTYALFTGSLMTVALATPLKPAPGAAPPSATGKPSAAAIAAGKEVYASNHCMACHKIAGKGGTSGPDLTKEGSSPKRAPKWMEEEIQNPKAHKPGSKMPAYGEKIKGKDLSNLVAYLRSPKQ